MEKIFEFKTELFGHEKVFRVHGKNYTEARKKLDAHILKSLKIKDHKDITPKQDFSSVNDIFENFGKIFGDDGIFGKKK